MSGSKSASIILPKEGLRRCAGKPVYPVREGYLPVIIAPLAAELIGEAA